MSLLNKKNCKEYLLNQSKLQRNGRFTRVSATMYPWLESVLRKAMDEFVHSHPSVGKTLTAIKTKE